MAGDDIGGSLRCPPGCSPVEEISQAEGLDYTVHAIFHKALSHPGQEKVYRPIILRGAKIKPPRRDGREQPSRNFTVGMLSKDFGFIRLPNKSERTQGTGGLFVGDQGNNDVLDDCWHPRHQRFQDLTEKIQTGESPLYMRLSSANEACQRSGKTGVIEFTDPAGPDVANGILKEFVDRAPVPCIVPFGKPFAVVFWMGSENKSFGLHSDLFTEQYFMQHEGEKEVYLMLPEDPSLVQPLPFLTNEKVHKSSLRTVLRMDMAGTGCQWAVLRPGDMLYLPPMWWHEFRTVSKGVSLSTTIRMQLPEDRAFYAIVRHSRLLYEKLLARGSRQLMNHTLLYLVRGLLMGMLGAPDGYYAGLLQRMLAPHGVKVQPATGEAAEASNDARVGKDEPLQTPTEAVESDDGGSTTATHQLLSDAPLPDTSREAGPSYVGVHTQGAEQGPSMLDEAVFEDQSCERHYESAVRQEKSTQTETDEYRLVFAPSDGNGGAALLGAVSAMPVGDLMAGLLAATSLGFVLASAAAVACLARHPTWPGLTACRLGQCSTRRFQSST
eukprot:CAMPEP_0171274796 /NCGR_PEP_ID=MMETSP0790-20130122/62993_1 /TAXON_ID=2925 /ORGANISM="Alexandrium catenella, Strain OF101" /LENGTH=552 /DNA_ID=CAMNT_0011743843 /DNA_START=29 /DNA_END=1685 /DNA_ORIENTATION=+